MSAEPLIALHGVDKSYDHGVLALDAVDLQITAGEAVAIVGRSGSGKSTLLAMLGLLDAPSRGRVEFDGEPIDVSSDSARSRRRAQDLGFVFQRSHLIADLTSSENVELSLRYAGVPEAEITERAQTALTEVDLGHRLRASARTLSGGEMQRVAIARAMTKDARLWLADEPTGNLDSSQSAEIIELMRARARARGATLVVVTHEPDIAARFERVVSLSDGRISSDIRKTPEAIERGDAVTAPRVEPSSDHRRRRRRGDLAAIIGRTVRFSTQSLLARSRRTWSAVAATSVAVALILIALGLAQSASNQVTEHFDSRRARQVSAVLSFDGDEPRSDAVTIEPLRSRPGVETAELRMLWEGTEMRNGDLGATTALLIVTDGQGFDATSTQIDWAPGHDRIGDGEVVLGNLLAERLGIAQFDLEPEIVIGNATHRVVGVVTSSRITSTAGAALLNTLPNPDWPPSHQVEVHVKTQPGAARTIADDLPLVVDPYGHGRVTVDPVLRPDHHRDELESDVATSLILLAVIASFSGLLALIALNLMDVTSRRAELGVRRAFGARRSEIVSLIVGESLFTGSLGAVLGTSLGFSVIMVVTAIARWHPVFDPRLVLVGAGAAGTFAVVGAIAPAIAAGRVQPADAVRT